VIPKLLNADWNYWPEKRSARSIWTSSATLGFDGIGYRGAMSLDMYGAVDEGVLGSEEASRFGYETMVGAAVRARAQR